MVLSLRSALRDRTLLHVFAFGQLCHPKLVEIVGFMGGFDAVWLDQEHVGLTLPQIEEATRAARAVGIDSFVRLPATDYATVMRVLEAGAGGIMASMVRRVEQVVNLVRWAKFFPEGERGVNGSGVDGRYGLTTFAEYFKSSNDRISLGVQIEHKDAVDCLDEILKVPGVDYLFIGPADLSQSLGIPGQWDNPLLWEAIELVARRCGEEKMPWAIMPLGVEFAKRCVKLGCRMLSTGMDVWAFHRGVRSLLADYAEVSS